MTDVQKAFWLMVWWLLWGFRSVISLLPSPIPLRRALELRRWNMLGILISTFSHFQLFESSFRQYWNTKGAVMQSSRWVFIVYSFCRLTAPKFIIKKPKKGKEWLWFLSMCKFYVVNRSLSETDVLDIVIAYRDYIRGPQIDLRNLKLLFRPF